MSLPIQTAFCFLFYIPQLMFQCPNASDCLTRRSKWSRTHLISSFHTEPSLPANTNHKLHFHLASFQQCTAPPTRKKSSIHQKKTRECSCNNQLNTIIQAEVWQGHRNPKSDWTSKRFCIIWDPKEEAWAPQQQCSTNMRPMHWVVMTFSISAVTNTLEQH